MSTEADCQELQDYNWDWDQEFQLGLKGILSSSQASSEEQTKDLTLRAQCFYFARKFGKRVDFDTYKAFKQTKVQALDGTPAPEQEQDEKSLSYAELVEMIQTGKPIPGIKDIPDTVLAGQGTESVASRRRKPWEKDNIDAASADTSEAVTQHEQQIAIS